MIPSKKVLSTNFWPLFPFYPRFSGVFNSSLCRSNRRYVFYKNFFWNILGNLLKKSSNGDFFLEKLMVAFNFIGKGLHCRNFYCKFYEIFHRRFFTECLRTAASIICILLKYHAIILAGVFQADCNLCVEWHPTRGVQFLVFGGFLVVLAGFWFWWRDWALGYNSMCFEIFLIFSNLLSS